MLRKKRLYLYTVEFSARFARMVVNGAVTVRARHWTRAREAARIRVVRAGFLDVRAFRPHQLFLVGLAYDTARLAF